MRQIELARRGSLSPPQVLRNFPAVELHHAAIAVAVGDIDLARWSKGDVGGLLN